MDLAWQKSSIRRVKRERDIVGGREEGWDSPLTWETVRSGGSAAYSARTELKINILDGDTYLCSFCQGKGEKPRGSLCSVCKGTGTVALQPPVIKCVYCRGRGEERPRSNITCTVCSGKGFVSVNEPIEMCPACDGRGSSRESKLPCTKCKGKGIIAATTYLKDEPADANRQLRDRNFYNNSDSRGRMPSGSEWEVLLAVKNLGAADSYAIGARMKISSEYAAHLSNSLCENNYLYKVSPKSMALTSKGEKVMRQKEIIK